MSEWVFIELPVNTIADLAAPELPYPIRREKMSSYDELKQEGLPLVLIAEELDRYLEEQPGRVERYRREAAHLFFCAGVECVMEKCAEESVHYFKLAVWLDPAQLPARVNMGMSLHQLGRGEEAIAQYREVMRLGSVWDWWQAWMLCAEELMALGRPEEAMPLLLEAKATVPDSHRFWELLSECEQKLNPGCPHCGAQLKTKTRFCGECGGKLA